VSVKLFGGGASTKALSVDQFFDYLAESGGNVAEAQTQYGNVAWTFRCVGVRAGAVSRVPYTVLEGENEYTWPFDLQNLFGVSESDLLLSGAAYWLKIIKNGNLTGLQRLNPWTMQVLCKPEPDKGLTEPKDGVYGFVQQTDKTRYYRPEQVVYFDFYYNPSDDVGPGISPAHVSRVPAQLTINMNDWAAKYFENGAIPLVVLETDASVPPNEQDRIRTAWNRMLQGVRRAWRTVVLNKGLSAKVIGSPVKDLAMPDLDTRVKEQFSAAYSVPMSMLEQGEVNRATAEMHWIQFYTETIVPECTQMQNVVNRDLMNDLGLEFRFDVNKLEALQQQEAQKAGAFQDVMSEINQSFELGVVDRGEARGILNVMLLQLGFPALADMDESQEVIETVEVPQIDIEDTEPTRNHILSDLHKWRDKSRKRSKLADFNSEYIPSWLDRQVKAAASIIDHVEAFRFLKQVEPVRDEDERIIKTKMQAIFKKWLPIFTAAVLSGQEPNYAKMTNEIKAALMPIFTSIYVEQAMRASMETGIAIDPAELNENALDWATRHVGELSTQLINTTRKTVDKVRTAINESPETETEEDIRLLLLPAFSVSRAEMIGVTEATRAGNVATVTVRDLLDPLVAQSGRVILAMWHTREDERVCPVCGPLDGELQETWGSQFPFGPPAHPNCRCWLEVVTI
jgi:HK97 family phage portal protein